jgi:PKD repeat protein
MKLNYRILSTLLLLSVSLAVFGQSNQKDLIQAYLTANQAQLQLKPSDFADWVITDSYNSKHNGVSHVYVNQRFSGIKLYGAISSIAIQNNQIVHFGNRFQRNLDSRINSTNPSLSAAQAVQQVANILELNLSSAPELTESPSEPNSFVFQPSGISRRDIQVELVYHASAQGNITLAWNVNIYTLDGQNWWNIQVDANTGTELDRDNWIVKCDFGHAAHEHTAACQHGHGNLPSLADDAPEGSTALGAYRVFPIPAESPNHGTHTLINDPSNATASPFGWHDNNGVSGADFTITRGNNVYAADDTSNLDVPGYSPDGGPSLNFNFPYNGNNHPNTWIDAAITNLFYMNNIMHDVWYQYGFDEEAGNFQELNYSGQGLGDDYVFADAQDGSGTNNANFGTPPDGSNPRMQMFLWSGNANGTVTINSPSGLAGAYTAAQAGFGGLNTVTGNLVLVDDGTAPTADGCENPFVNAAALSGKVAMVDRGTCQFGTKCLFAEANGAIGVVVCNNQAGAPTSMASGNDGFAVTIPCFMMSQADCNLIKIQLNAGQNVNITLAPQTVVPRDSDVDNGIIAHEYTHGISNRLTGGPSNTSCLTNEEQMGEGWSDWYCLMVTIKSTDVGTAGRGIGTYASGQPTTATGIRPYAYSTDMTINPQTYGQLANFSIPHGVGSVWCTTLWDLTWALIDLHGFDPDYYNGTGGNNIAMQLVTDGLKLQACNPGFIDGRDAILLADQLYYGGAHQCLIWEVFARRGIGYSAQQGSNDVVGDEIEAFDVPPTCQLATQAPVAAFVADVTSTCSGTVNFSDQSTNVAQAWSWNFGDGNTSTLQNPSHTYTAEGTYTVILTVTNNIGSDSETRTAYITVNFLDAPQVNGASVCTGQSAALSTSNNPNTTAQWYDANNNLLFTGNTFNTPALTSNTSYQVMAVENKPIANVGPLDNTIGGGGYHNTGFDGRLMFTALKPFRILSFWVDAGNAGSRTITLRDENTNQVVDTKTVTIPNGQSRVNINLEVPYAGDFSIGNANLNLYRNNAGVNFPYTLANIVSITGSSATGGNPTYYYFYDWAVQEIPCESPLTPVQVAVAGPLASFSNSAGTSSTITFTNSSSGATSYSWAFGDGNSSTDANPVHTYANPGTYSVTLTATNGACSNTSVQTVSVLVGTSLPEGASIQLFPNPSKGQTNLSMNGFPDNELIIEILASDGRLVLSQQFSMVNGSHEFDLRSLANGLYLLKISSGTFTTFEKLHIVR